MSQKKLSSVNFKDEHLTCTKACINSKCKAPWACIRMFMEFIFCTLVNTSSILGNSQYNSEGFKEDHRRGSTS